MSQNNYLILYFKHFWVHFCTHFIYKEEYFIKSTFRKKEEQTELVNNQIPNTEVLLIDENGSNRGIMPRNEALKLAQAAELDLVVVSSDKTPLVAKIMDYPKFKFDQQKKLKEIRKNQQIIQIKEIRLGPTIQENDFTTKLNAAKKFLEHGDKVKISMRFRGRMIEKAQIGIQIVKRFLEELKDLSNIEQKPNIEGQFLNAVLAPMPKKK